MSAIVLLSVIHTDGTIDPATELASCDHCGIVVVRPQDFGWHMWHDEDGELRHHCPAAVQYNDMLAGGLIHMTDPNDAVIYEDWPQ